jgi:hypothetical protein
MPGMIMPPPLDGRPGFNHRYREHGCVLLVARERVIGKGDFRADEHIIFNSQAVSKLQAGFYGDPITYYYVVLDQGFVADFVVVSVARVG